MMDAVAHYSFALSEGRVEVRLDDKCVWTFLASTPWMHFALPGTSDGIVVLDWMDRPKGVESWHPCQNLLRIRPDGSIVWQASLPSAETLKSFTAAKSARH
jgi:hypothetical protein